MKACRVGLVGTSGYGAAHLEALLRLVGEGSVSVDALCDVRIDRESPGVRCCLENGARVYESLDELLRAEHLDLAVLATPLHLHKQMTIDCLDRGVSVFLEKPPALSPADLDEMLAAQRRASLHCAVDFQNTCGPAFRRLRRLVADGVLGDIRTIAGIGLWKRPDSYYARTPWAGRLAYNGHPVLDGTLFNPLSHLLNNILLLAGSAGKGTIRSVTAELYHGHDIEGEDTACVRLEMAGGLTACFYATLCSPLQQVPYIEVTGSASTAVWNYENRLEVPGAPELGLCAPCPHIELTLEMYRNLCGVLAGADTPLHCSLADTRAFVAAADGAFRSSGGTHGIPGAFVERYPEGNSITTVISGIDALLGAAMRGASLLSETGCPWARAGRLEKLGD